MNDKKRLEEIVNEIDKLITEFTDIVKSKMDRAEFEDFKYNTLGHLQPMINSNHDWVTSRYSSQKSLEKVSESFIEDESLLKVGMTVKIKETGEICKIIDTDKYQGKIEYVTDDGLAYQEEEIEIIDDKPLTPSV